MATKKNPEPAKKTVTKVAPKATEKKVVAKKSKAEKLAEEKKPKFKAAIIELLQQEKGTYAKPGSEDRKHD